MGFHYPSPRRAHTQLAANSEKTGRYSQPHRKHPQKSRIGPCFFPPEFGTPVDASRISVRVPLGRARLIRLSPVPDASSVVVPVSGLAPPDQVTLPVRVTSLMAFSPVNAAIDFDVKETA
jgi:hypothetical protein